MIVDRLVVGALETNCYVAGCPRTREAAVIDPGADAQKILSRVEAGALSVRWIIDTHGHADHIAANADLKAAFPEACLAVHEADAAYLEQPALNLSLAFGVPVTSPPADRLLHDGDEIAVGSLRFRVIHVPGHTPGGIALYARDSDEGGTPVLFDGDAIFAGSIGRSDFPGGSHRQLVEAIRERLLILPPETVVYSGHGEPTTIGAEAATNPFLL